MDDCKHGLDNACGGDDDARDTPILANAAAHSVVSTYLLGRRRSTRPLMGRWPPTKEIANLE